MARKIPRDSSVAEWSANRYVESGPDFSLIKTGFLNTSLFLPISNDRRVCLARHKLYADWKYSGLFTSSQFIEELSSPNGKISDAIILTAPGNHWHFIIDGLANLSEATFAHSSRVFVDRNLTEDQIDFLKLYVQTLGIENLTIERLDESAYYLRNTYIPTNKSFAAKVAAFRACLGRIQGLRRHPDANKRIYVSRKNSEIRKLINEDELIPMLQMEFGFHPILNENYNIIEQLSIYREAEVVMGPHGAGLTNIIFADNPSLFVEMFNSYQQPFYPALSQALGIRYLGIPGTSAVPAGAEDLEDNSPFRVDVERIRLALRDLLT